MHKFWNRDVLLILFVFFVVFSSAPTLADDLIGIRCTGYEEPIVMFPSSKVLGFVTREEPFDIHINLSRRVGWWRGATFNIDEDNPGTLTTDVTSYRLDANKLLSGQKAAEWIVIDRIEGSFIQFARMMEGVPSGVLKKGGKCAKLEPKF